MTDLKKHVINPLQAASVVGSTKNAKLLSLKNGGSSLDRPEFDLDAELEKEQVEIDKFEQLFDKICRSMAVGASEAFFDETIGSDFKTNRLGKILVPFMEKGLLKAFKSKQGLKTFLVNLEYLPDDEDI